MLSFADLNTDAIFIPLYLLIPEMQKCRTLKEKIMDDGWVGFHTDACAREVQENESDDV